MLNGRDYLKLEDLVSRMERTKVKTRRINIPGMGSADILDTEETSVLRDGVIETRTTEHATLLDCGHLSIGSTLIGACDICGILACEKCFIQCPQCASLTCRYCRDKSNITEKILCDVCKSKENRKLVTRTIAGFFVIREEK